MLGGALMVMGAGWFAAAKLLQKTPLVRALRSTTRAQRSAFLRRFCRYPASWWIGGIRGVVPLPGFAFDLVRPLCLDTML
jgi:hypothetical protein